MNLSFYNGVSGIKKDTSYLDTIAENIANINTVGYKKSNASEFSTIFSTTLSDSYFSPTSNDVGLGVRKTASTLNMSQGIFKPTDQKFDFAIGGDGWFGVQGAKSKIFYTRAGAFNVDANGDLVNQGGNYLLATNTNNITPTTLPQSIMDNYGKNGTTPAKAFAVSDVGDIPLGSAGSQTKIHLPNILYYPPIATTKVTYKANLNPKVNIASTQIALSNSNIGTISKSIPNKTISITNGSILNNIPAILNPKKDDSVLITITDKNGKAVKASTKLDNNLNWSISNKDISTLDVTNPLSVTAKLVTKQEIPNVEHFSSTIISPTGKKDILDMTYTKEIPQPATGSVWNANLNILSFYEKLNSSKVYDTNIYQIDKNGGNVYKIIDSKTGKLSFDSSGKLLSSSIPILSNGGTPLNINIGTPNTFDGFVSSVSLDKSRTEQHDGQVSGLLTNYGLDQKGNIIADFDNGKSVAIAKVAIYHFQNNQGLEKAGSALFKESANSGKAIFFTDKNGKSILGAHISSHKLENSNVDLTVAMSELILAQRTYGASAKSITTSDQMIQNAINMKK